MKSPIQQIIEQIDAVKRDEPKSALFNLKKIAVDLLGQEKRMVADAWIDGNKKGWSMQTDWPEDGEFYYDEHFPNNK